MPFCPDSICHCPRVQIRRVGDNQNTLLRAAFGSSSCGFCLRFDHQNIPIWPTSAVKYIRSITYLSSDFVVEPQAQAKNGRLNVGQRQRSNRNRDRGTQKSLNFFDESEPEDSRRTRNAPANRTVPEASQMRCTEKRPRARARVHASALTPQAVHIPHPLTRHNPSSIASQTPHSLNFLTFQSSSQVAAS